LIWIWICNINVL